MRRRVIGLVFVVCALASGPANAQCGAKPSSCSTCHDGARAALPARAPWHEDHGFADLCASCHGGRADVDDLAGAHEGLMAPLGPAGPCGSCHGPQAAALVDRYRQAETKPLSHPETTAPGKTSPHGERGPNLALVLVMATVGALGGIFIAHRERERQASHGSSASLHPRSS